MRSGGAVAMGADHADLSITGLDTCKLRDIKYNKKTSKNKQLLF
jgi:hypothetical protein